MTCKLRDILRESRVKQRTSVRSIMQLHRCNLRSARSQENHKVVNKVWLRHKSECKIVQKRLSFIQAATEQVQMIVARPILKRNCCLNYADKVRRKITCNRKFQFLMKRRMNFVAQMARLDYKMHWKDLRTSLLRVLYSSQSRNMNLQALDNHLQVAKDLHLQSKEIVIRTKLSQISQTNDIKKTQTQKNNKRLRTKLYLKIKWKKVSTRKQCVSYRVVRYRDLGRVDTRLPQPRLKSPQVMRQTR